MTSTTISEHTDTPDEFVWAGGAELSRHDGSADGIVEYWVGPGPREHGLAAPAGTDGADRIKDQWAWSLVDDGEEYQMAAEAWREASATAPSACGSDRRRLDDSSEFEGAMTVDEDVVEGSAKGTYVRFTPIGTDGACGMIESQYDIDKGHPRRYRFERDIVYTEDRGPFDCYDEIQKQRSNGQ